MQQNTNQSSQLRCGGTFFINRPAKQDENANHGRVTRRLQDTIKSRMNLQAYAITAAFHPDAHHRKQEHSLSNVFCSCSMTPTRLANSLSCRPPTLRACRGTLCFWITAPLGNRTASYQPKTKRRTLMLLTSCMALAKSGSISRCSDTYRLPTCQPACRKTHPPRYWNKYASGH